MYVCCQARAIVCCSALQLGNSVECQNRAEPAAKVVAMVDVTFTRALLQPPDL